MSLINHMLQNLDSRQAAGGEPLLPTAFPEGVRPTLSRAPKISARQLVKKSLLLSLPALLIAAAGYGLYSALQSYRAAPVQKNIGLSMKTPAVAAPIAQPQTTAAAEIKADAEDSDPASTPQETGAPPSGDETAVNPPPTDDQRLKEEANAMTLPASAARDSLPALPSSETPAVPVTALSSQKPPPPAFQEEGSAQKHARAAEENLPVATPLPAKIDRTPRGLSETERQEARYREAVALTAQFPDEAAEILTELLRQRPLYHAARQMLVKIRIEQNRKADAETLLRHGLELSPQQDGWRMLLAKIEADAGQKRTALATLEAGLPGSGGENVNYLALAAALCRQLGLPERAQSYYRQAVALAPREGRLWVGMGLALEEQGRAAEAREAFLRARENDLPPELSAFVAQKITEKK
ncbi:MAG: tetratricopeptide repeat protein [Zoogloeaceae bacterium]|jgi:MSHA biogenesis protein MshN|nr:tetratricopeptide repeat protein [Zoogloeaceae bacterium]